MHDSNFYPNFAPIQELDDWFEHWASEGSAGITCEYGAPFTWDWTMYRGWYKDSVVGQRQGALGILSGGMERTVLSAIALIKSARRRRRISVGRPDSFAPATFGIAGIIRIRLARIASTNGIRYSPCISPTTAGDRTWGVSGISPWDYWPYWKLRAGVDKGRKELKVDWGKSSAPRIQSRLPRPTG